MIGVIGFILRTAVLILAVMIVVALVGGSSVILLPLEAAGHLVRVTGYLVSDAGSRVSTPHWRPLEMLKGAAFGLLLVGVAFPVLALVTRRLLLGRSTAPRLEMPHYERPAEATLELRRRLGLEPPEGMTPEAWIIQRSNEILDGSIQRRAEDEARVAWLVEEGLDPEELDNLESLDPWRPIGPDRTRIDP